MENIDIRQATIDKILYFIEAENCKPEDWYEICILFQGLNTTDLVLYDQCRRGLYEKGVEFMKREHIDANMISKCVKALKWLNGFNEIPIPEVTLLENSYNYFLQGGSLPFQITNVISPEKLQIVCQGCTKPSIENTYYVSTINKSDEDKEFLVTIKARNYDDTKKQYSEWSNILEVVALPKTKWYSGFIHNFNTNSSKRIGTCTSEDSRFIPNTEARINEYNTNNPITRHFDLDCHPHHYLKRVIINELGNELADFNANNVEEPICKEVLNITNETFKEGFISYKDITLTLKGVVYYKGALEVAPPAATYTETELKEIALDIYKKNKENIGLATDKETEVTIKDWEDEITSSKVEDRAYEFTVSKQRLIKTVKEELNEDYLHYPNEQILNDDTWKVLESNDKGFSIQYTVRYLEKIRPTRKQIMVKIPDHYVIDVAFKDKGEYCVLKLVSMYPFKIDLKNFNWWSPKGDITEIKGRAEIDGFKLKSILVEGWYHGAFHNIEYVVDGVTTLASVPGTNYYYSKNNFNVRRDQTEAFGEGFKVISYEEKRNLLFLLAVERGYMGNIATQVDSFRTKSVWSSAVYANNINAIMMKARRCYTMMAGNKSFASFESVMQWPTVYTWRGIENHMGFIDNGEPTDGIIPGPPARIKDRDIDYRNTSDRKLYIDLDPGYSGAGCGTNPVGGEITCLSYSASRTTGVQAKSHRGSSHPIHIGGVDIGGTGDTTYDYEIGWYTMDWTDVNYGWGINPMRTTYKKPKKPSIQLPTLEYSLKVGEVLNLTDFELIHADDYAFEVNQKDKSVVAISYTKESKAITGLASGNAEIKFTPSRLGVIIGAPTVVRVTVLDTDSVPPEPK